MNDKIIYLECKCHCPGHSIKFILDNDKEYGPELYVYTQLHSTDSFFKRCWYALKYIFKKDLPFGHWEETIIKDNDVSNLLNVLAEFKKEHETSRPKNW